MNERSICVYLIYSEMVDFTFLKYQSTTRLTIEQWIIYITQALFSPKLSIIEILIFSKFQIYSDN